MKIQDLLDEIKEGLPASAWSAAVLANRRGEVTLYSKRGDLHLMDVQMGRPLPYRVELQVKEGDWSCSCASKDASCAHVAAAALALAQLEKGGKPATSSGSISPQPTTCPIRHCFRLEGSRSRLESFRVLGDGQLQPIETPPLDCSPADRQVLELRQGLGESGSRQLRLLQALALCSDVWVGSLKVDVTPEPIKTVLLVTDHPRGIQVTLGPREKLHLHLPGSGLVVVGDPPVLRPLSRSTLRDDEISLYQAGRVFSGPSISSFFSETLPRLRERTPVENRSQVVQSQTRSRPYPRLSITATRGGLDIVPTVTYGTPPEFTVLGERLLPLPTAREVPTRDFDHEKRCARHIEAILRVAPGRRLSLQGQEAARFAADVLPNFKGRVEGRAIAERMKLHDVKLVPEWQEDAQQQLVLSFRMPRPRQVGLDDSGMAEANAPTGQASLEEVVAAWQEGRSLIPLMDGGFARLPHDWMEQYGTLVEALLEAREQNEPALTRLARATLLEAVPTPPELDRLKKAALDQLAIPPVSVPAGLKASLRGYQLEGLAQLVHWQREKQGGILADDMGLGKTIQTLALMLTDPPDAPPSLVVAPTSVLENWAREAAKFAPGLTTAIYHGEDRELAGLDASGEKRVRLLITSYGILRRDEAILAERSWQRLILDEAQAIKNPDSQAAAAARKIGARALHRLALTGTPVENRLAEIWSLLEFLNPGLLGDKRRFEDTFSRPVLQGDRKMLERLRIRVRPFLLRRLKQDVAKDLPPKTERILKAELSAHERKVYEAVRTAGRSEVRKLMKEKGLRGSQLQILEILLRLRQACCHPGLVPGASSEHELGSSAKLELLVDELEVILDEGHKALVFSQWTSLLDRAQQRLEKAGISYVRLDGSTRNRQEVVDQFQSETGPGVFLISLKAGGVGLNLTAADHVFLLDPWWNPAAEDQATDRAYRIGQTRPVFVSRLIAARTIEERVQWLQEQKRAIADAALGGEVSFLESLDEQGIELLLSM